ncbi:MAG: transporter substrate-binding domain-containing protein [bacterium]|nr:transporter substrate-binding domain-containing protein [bacterium]
MKRLLVTCMILGVMVSAVNAQEIKVVTEEWEPNNYMENGEVVGVATDIVKATLAKSGIEAEIKVYPWARAYNMALEQENVLIYSIYRSEKREELFKWVCPIIPRSDYFLFKLKKRTDIVVNSLEDAKKYRVGVMKDDYGHQFMLGKGFEEDQSLDVASDEKINLRKLFGERVEFIIGTELTLAVRAKKLELPFDELEKTILVYSEDPDSSCMAFSKQTSDELVERVRAAHEQVKAEGFIEATMEKYLKKYQ